MNFETPKIENIKNKESLDDKWYERFKEVGSFQDFEYLVGDKKYREEQKQKFLSEEIENPALDYPELEKFKFEEVEAKLLQLKKDILENEKNDIVRQLYRWRINEKIAETRMLKAAKERNDRKFSRYSEFIYGKPQKDIFEYGFLQIKDLIEDKTNSSHLDIRSAANRLKEELFSNENNLSKSNILKISPENSSLAKIAKNPECSSEEIKSAFQGALDIFQVEGFKVFVDKEGKYNSINVSQEKSAAIIPQDRKVRFRNLQGLMVHEIGYHAGRRTRGERSKLKLLGLGLDRFLKGEEGLATYSEQIIEGAEDYSGFDGHFAISLASGIDGRKRNFREVFNILKDYYFMKSRKKKDEATKSAVNSAWNQCIRVFRGTTCQTPGACFTRDIVYREGNIGVWNVLKNNPEEVKRFSIGKYDPANPRHIWILDQLEITEKDLQTLEKEG